jgi:hypothetical protein
MANLFTLTDGTTTVSLNAGSYLSTSYKMATVDERNTSSVTETLEITVSGANLGAIQTNVRAIELLVEAAKRRKTNQSGPRVYFTVQWDTEATSWRAEVNDARLETTDVPDQFRRGKVDVALILTRGPFEGAEVALSLTNANGTNVTTGLKVYNHDDAGTGHDNFVTIDAAEIAGTLPAPVRIQLTNDSDPVVDSGNRSWRNWWMAVNAWNDPANFAHVLEGESRVTGYGTSTASAACSGGNYNALSVTASGWMEWDLSAAFVNRCAGYPFRILVRFTGAHSLTYAQACVYDSTGLVLQAEGDLTQLDGYAVADLGVLRIPADTYSTGYAALRLVIKFTCTGTQAANVDYVQFMPADTTRLAIQRGMTQPIGSLTEINEVEGRAWMYMAGGEAPLYILQGKPLMLTPGKLQRIYFLVSDSTGGSNISDAWTVQAWYRPRRWSV